MELRCLGVAVRHNVAERREHMRCDEHRAAVCTRVGCLASHREPDEPTQDPNGYWAPWDTTHSNPHWDQTLKEVLPDGTAIYGDHAYTPAAGVEAEPIEDAAE